MLHSPSFETSEGIRQGSVSEQLATTYLELHFFLRCDTESQSFIPNWVAPSRCIAEEFSRSERFQAVSHSVSTHVCDLLACALDSWHIDMPLNLALPLCTFVCCTWFPQEITTYLWIGMEKGVMQINGSRVFLTLDIKSKGASEHNTSTRCCMEHQHRVQQGPPSLHSRVLHGTKDCTG